MLTLPGLPIPAAFQGKKSPGEEKVPAWELQGLVEMGWEMAGWRVLQKEGFQHRPQLGFIGGLVATGNPQGSSISFLGLKTCFFMKNAIEDQQSEPTFEGDQESREKEEAP